MFGLKKERRNLVEFSRRKRESEGMRTEWEDLRRKIRENIGESRKEENKKRRKDGGTMNAKKKKK